jgi:alpha-L-fucosidase
MNDHWGYNLVDHDFKSVPALIGMLVETASKGGNLLLNVGPRADGTFPDESVERLAAIGKWMGVNGAAIHGTTASLFAKAPFRSTTQGNRIYLFLTEWPEADTLSLPGLKTPVARAYALADPSKTAIVVNAVGGGAAGAGVPSQSLILPRNEPDPICSVVVLEFDSAPEVG